MLEYRTKMISISIERASNRHRFLMTFQIQVLTILISILYYPKSPKMMLKNHQSSDKEDLSKPKVN